MYKFPTDMDNHVDLTVGVGDGMGGGEKGEKLGQCNRITIKFFLILFIL